jgi:hypothetical protein
MSPRWRVGRKLGRTLYLNNKLVGLVDTPELAMAIVAAMNQPYPRGPHPLQESDETIRTELAKAEVIDEEPEP